MLRIELVYFDSCPNVDKARASIRAANVEYREVNLSLTSQDNPYCGYSSPTILVNGKIAAGSRNGASACSIIDWADVPNRILALSSP